MYQIFGKSVIKYLIDQIDSFKYLNTIEKFKIEQEDFYLLKELINKGLKYSLYEVRINDYKKNYMLESFSDIINNNLNN